MGYAQSIYSPPEQVETFGETANIVFQAGVLSAAVALNNPSDIWGNVKIPVLQDLDASLADSDGWIPVPNSNVSYTSLIGSPIFGISPEGNSSLPITTSYFYATCGDPILYPSDTDEFTWPVQDGSNTCTDNSPPILLGGNRKRNGTILGSCSVGSLLDNQWNKSETSASQLRPILFQSQSIQGVSAFNCSIEYFTSESVVECNGSNCSVTYVRAADSSTPSWISPLEDCATAQNFYNQFAVACQPFQRAGSNASVSSILEVYLMFNGFRSSGMRQDQPAVDLSQLSGSVLSDRFTKVLNSFWTASILPDFVPGTISTFDNATQNDPGITSLTSGVIQGFTEVHQTILVYVCDPVWVFWLGISCCVFILLALNLLLMACTVEAADLFACTTSVMRVPLLESRDGGSLPDTAFIDWSDDNEDPTKHNWGVRLKDPQPGQKIRRLALTERNGPERVDSPA